METSTGTITATAGSTGGTEVSVGVEPLSPGDDLVAWVASVGPELERHADRHDRDGTWVQESYVLLSDSGYMAAGVPVELGGLGASISEVSAAQREMARYCASTALATSMHQHVTAFTAWRYRRGMAGAEATLRRVAEERIVLVSTGAGDLTRPRGEARRVDGGFVVSGRKVFASGSPVGSVMSTMFAYDDPDRGLRVLNMPVPFADPGVRVLENWDALGMRGTGSNDIVIEEVFVPDEKVMADRPHGVIDPPLQVVLTIGFSIVAGVYLGVAEGARDKAVGVAGPSDDPIVQRQVGLMDHRIRVAGWALDGALQVVGDDPAPSMSTLQAVFTAKREIVLASMEICDLAMSVAGGRGFAKGSPIERAYRDVRGGPMHPFNPEQTLLLGGRLALGVPCDEW